MTRILTIFSVWALTVGCAAHFCRIKDDGLELVLNKPDARQVYLASSQDGFEPHAARNINGRWVVSLPLNAPFRYYYVVDGEIYIPPCKMKENDDFGSQNCIFESHL